MKHTAKILCIALSLVMLFAMSVPAMAEGTINKLDYTLNEKFDSETDGYFTMLSSDSKKRPSSTDYITDDVYEFGVKVRATLDDTPNEADSGEFFYTQIYGSSSSNPTINLKYNVDSEKISSVYLTSDEKETYTFSEGQIKSSDWNEFKFKVTRSNQNITSDGKSVSADFTVSMYVNGNYIHTFKKFTYSKTHSTNDITNYLYTKAVTLYTGGDCVADFDDVYFAKYTPVADFNRNATVKVVKGQEAVLPATINDVAVTWGAINEETNNATGLLDGYSVDVKATAAIQEIDMPYTAAISDNTLTITKETSYAPAAKIYGATYEGNKLTAVNEIGTIAADEEWNGTTKTVAMGNHTKAFIWDSALVPLANIAQ